MAMRILFLSNYYPPFEIGGYEQLCRDVVQRMLARGHGVRVLTSDCGVKTPVHAGPPYVRRDLKLHVDYSARMNVPLQFLWRRRRAAAHDLRSLRAQVAEFQPEVILIWNLQGLPRSLAIAAEAFADVGVAYWLAGYSPAEPDEYWLYWTNRGLTPRAEVFKALLRRPALALLRREGYPLRPAMRHVAVVSKYMRHKGVAEGTLPAHTRVIYNGVEVEQFLRPVCHSITGGLNLLQAGRVSADKGVHIAIEAVGQMARRDPDIGVHLFVAGSGPAGYLAELHDLVRRDGIGDRVSFLGWLPREQMPALLGRCHVLLLPTIYQEPFARVVLEAMAAGLAVVAAKTGGSSEIVEHEVTGLLCPPGDSADLAAQVERLLAEPGLRQRLAAEGQRRVLARFNLERMVDELEALLAGAAADRRRTP
jgi:glycosyltransferase involved in cell wall biosynthesis